MKRLRLKDILIEGAEIGATKLVLTKEDKAFIQMTIEAQKSLEKLKSRPLTWEQLHTPMDI